MLPTMDGPFPLFDLAGDEAAVVVHRAVPHSHGEIELNFVEGEPVSYLLAGSAVTFPPHRLIAYWAALPHCTLASAPSARLWWITLPLRLFATWATPACLAQLLAGRTLALPEEAGGPARLRRWIAGIRAPPTSIAGRSTRLELEATVLRLGEEGRPLPGAALTWGPGAAPRTTPPASAGGVPPAVARICTFLAHRYRERILLADCARAAGCSSAQARALFRRTYGLTIHAYLVRLRLAHAQRLLLTGERDLLQVALDAGFGSQARFYAAFRRAFGTTPGAVRRTGKAIVAR